MTTTTTASIKSSKPIQMIVPYVQGGGSDQRARLVARYMGLHLGRTIEVANRTGAVVGHTAIAQAAPDGLTIGQISGEIGMMHWTPGLTPLKPTDYTPLAVPFVESAAIIVKAESPHASLGDFLNAARSGPIRGSGGPNFSVWKFALIGLLDAMGIDVSNVSWTETLSGEQGLANVTKGMADVAPITLVDARGPLRSGEARALATMEDKRHPVFPEVPTVKEAVGVDWSVAHWRGIVAPAGLPQSIAADYIDALRAVSNDADFQAEAAKSSFTLRWRLGDEFAQYMAEDDELFGRIIGLLGARAGSASSLL